MPNLNPIRALANVLQHCNCRSRQSVDVVDTRLNASPEHRENENRETENRGTDLQAHQQDLDRAARSRFEALPISSNALEAGLNRWANVEGISSEQQRQRQVARERIAEAYRNNTRQLSLGGLGLTELPAEIGRLSAVRELNLTQNQLTQLPTAIGQLRDLEALDISLNAIGNLPPEIGQLNALETLDLKQNQLTELPTEISQLRALEYLDLSLNQLTDLPSGFGQLNALNSLDLESNPLINVPAEIIQLTALREFSLENTQITSLPAAIAQLTALEYLDASFNQLSQLPTEIGQLTALRNLYLEGNELGSLPAQIGQLTDLRNLDLEDNQLTHLPPEMVNLNALEFLYLNSNQFSHLELSSLPANNRLSINLEDNLFSNNNITAFSETQQQADYTGPYLRFSEVDAQQTDNLSAANIKEVLDKLGHNTDHPLWSALEQRSDMGDVANDFTLLLAKLYNQAPRENNQPMGRIRQHIDSVLSGLEQLHEQSKGKEIEDILNNAHDAVATCVDRAAIHLLMMSAKSQYYQNDDPQALDDFYRIHATIGFVARLYKNDEHKLVFDNNSQTFQLFFDMTHDNYICGD